MRNIKINIDTFTAVLFTHGFKLIAPDMMSEYFEEKITKKTIQTIRKSLRKPSDLDE